MLRRRILVVSTLAIGAVALTLTPASADPSPDALAATSPTAEPVPPGMLGALQRDLRLTPDQARARFSTEQRASRIEKNLRPRLGAKYAGAWVTPDATAVVVATTDAAAAPDITSQGAVPQVVTRSLADLNGVKDALDRAAAQAPTTVPSWYVDVQTNSVVVQANQPGAADAFIAAGGVDRAALQVVSSTEQPRPLYDIRGGDAFYIDNTYRCSIGFAVTKGSTRGFVDAGHCGSPGSTTTGYNNVAQGTFQASSFPGNDYSWVAVNANWTPRGVVNTYSGTTRVAGSTEAVEGSSICRSGSTTGWHCGTVQQRGATVRYSQGTVSGLTRTNVCAEPGDSGGSFISGTQAQGVTSGGSGNCTSGGTTYFQPVNEILSAYGLTLTTS
jgi:streptogrisin C